MILATARVGGRCYAHDEACCSDCCIVRSRWACRSFISVMASYSLSDNDDDGFADD